MTTSFLRRAASPLLLSLSFFLAITGMGSAHGQELQRPKSTPGAPRVAVFVQRGFPSYGVGSQVSPSQIAEELRAAGITVDRLDVAALANPEQLRTSRYAAVVLPYGNTYPEEAFANLRRFHQNGGSLITSGIPFTHAIQRSPRDWNASPEWGEYVQVRHTGDGKAALRIRGRESDWAGVSSARFPVQPGDAVSVSAAVQQEPPAKRAKMLSAPAGDGDRLFVRFFDKDGKYLRQDGVPLEGASLAAVQTFRAAATAPADAAMADLSIQVRRPGSVLLVTAPAATVGTRPVALPNADLSRSETGFHDLGHSDDPAQWSAEGIGIGGFAGPDRSGHPVLSPIAADDPFHLAGLGMIGPRAWQGPQWLDLATVPAGVRIVPVVGEPKRPLVALIVQKSGPYKGAVDVWAYRGPEGDREDYNTQQLIVRGTVAVLTWRGLIGTRVAETAFRKFAALPKPPIYANLTLPRPARRYATFQPKMPALARHLYVADVRPLDREAKVMLQSLQGIVNRKQPRIYLIFSDDDQRWLEETQRQGATDDPIPVADPWTLFDTFRSSYKGAVLCDPRIYVSPCVAASLAGADDRLLALTPAVAARAKVPITVDLRGKFKNDTDALHYLRTSVLPRLDPYLACSLDPAVYDAGGLDHVIAGRGLFFWITGPRAQQLPGADQGGETAEIRALFAQLPLGTVVRGFWWHGDGIGLQEGDGVALGSRFGKVTLVSDLISNLSVHSGVPATRLIQKPRAPAPPLDRKKVYVAFTMSDGDNLCTWRGYFRRYFDDPVRGTFPVGWGMAPTLLDLAPVWARWYYDKATPNDEFICDVSGVAYMYPPSWATALKDRDAAFSWFYGKTQDYMGRMDMKTVRLMDVGAEDIAKVGPLLPDTSFLMPDYGFAGMKSYQETTYKLPTGQAVFRAVTNGSGPANLADQIRKRAGATRPAFVNAFIWNWGSSLGDLKKTLEILGPDYVAVTPSQLNALYGQAQQAAGGSRAIHTH